MVTVNISRVWTKLVHQTKSKNDSDRVKRTSPTKNTWKVSNKKLGFMLEDKHNFDKARNVTNLSCLSVYDRTSTTMKKEKQLLWLDDDMQIWTQNITTTTKSYPK